MIRRSEAKEDHFVIRRSEAEEDHFVIRRSEAEEDQVMQQSMEPGLGGSAEERKNKQINPINNRDSDDRKEMTSEKGGASHA